MDGDLYRQVRHAPELDGAGTVNLDHVGRRRHHAVDAGENRRRVRADAAIVDEYLDEAVFDYIDSIGPAVSVQMITGNKKPMFARLLHPFQAVRPNVEAREEAMGPVTRIDVGPHDVAAGVDPEGIRADRAGEIDGREMPVFLSVLPPQKKAMGGRKIVGQAPRTGFGGAI